MNLLQLTLIIVLIQNLVKIIGQQIIVEFLWNLYTKISSTPSIQKLNQLQKDQFQTYKEQQQISAQDEYAKWTKLNRKLDNLKKDIETTSQEIITTRSSFFNFINTLIYILLKLPLFIISAWYRSSPIYYLPKNSLPSYLVWFLRFPSAPPNSIGITVWCFSINTICDTLVTLIKDLFIKETKPVKQL